MKFSEAKRKIRNLRPGEEEKHLEMLNLCFDPWGSIEKWKKMYVQPNFDVTKNVVIVEENGEWAGGGTAWFREALTKTSKKIKVYLAGDLYVHPHHRGKGIYSTAMRSLNDLAQKRGAAIGFAFPSIYRTPSIALPKYGFARVFHPTTRILVLNPEKFLQYLIHQAQEAYLPRKFEGLRLKLVVCFNLARRGHKVLRTFQVKKGKLCELASAVEDTKKFDLTINTDIDILLGISACFYLRQKALFPRLLLAFFRRRLRVRFSLNFLRSILGLYKID